MGQSQALAKQIRLIICDVDGVLTDGKIHLNSDGTEAMSFHVQDGLGIQLLSASDLHFAVITARKSPMVAKRMEALGVRWVFQGATNKLHPFNLLMTKLALGPKQVAYMGDDLPDIPCMALAGLAIAVANAVPAVREIADWQTQLTGGNGAVREACHFILSAQNNLNSANQHYLDALPCDTPYEK